MATTSIPIADGEWSSRTSAQETLWLAVDGVGTKRNIISGTGTTSELIDSSSKVASVCKGGLVPILQVIGGAMVVGSAIAHTIPKAHEEYSGASKEYQIAKKILNRSPDKPRLMRQAEEGMLVAKLGLANQYLYGAMGAGLAANGTVTLMGPDTAKLIGFHSVVGTSASTAAGAALGVVYLIRGSVMIGRSLYNLHYLRQFENDYKTALQLKGETKTDLEEALDRAIGVADRIGRDSHALKRRIGDEVPPLGPNPLLDDKLRYLEAIDRGIHTKKLQQKIGLIIGIAMIVGGLASIAAIFFSGGLAIPIIGLISAVFFTAMESIFAVYDSSRIFEKLRKRLYQPSQELQQIQALVQKIKEEEARQVKETTVSSWTDQLKALWATPTQAFTDAPAR
jgi:hypothetical protein